jgi:hypothetical protein
MMKYIHLVASGNLMTYDGSFTASDSACNLTRGWLRSYFICYKTVIAKLAQFPLKRHLEWGG